MEADNRPWRLPAQGKVVSHCRSGQMEWTARSLSRFLIGGKKLLSGDIASIRSRCARPERKRLARRQPSVCGRSLRKELMPPFEENPVSDFFAQIDDPAIDPQVR